MKQEIFLGEINKLDKIDLVVLSCFGHVGIDYVGNLFDNNKQVIRFPPLSFFRYLKIYKNKGIKIDDSIQINKLTDIIINNFLKKAFSRVIIFFKIIPKKNNLNYFLKNL